MLRRSGWFAVWIWVLLPVFAQADDTIVLLGDSITKAVRPGITKEQTFGALLEKSLKAEGQKVRVLNLGIGGERTDQGLARLDRAVLSESPRIVTIMYGANDSYVDKGKTETRIPVAQFKENLKTLVRSVRKARGTPILMTSPRIADRVAPNGRGEHPNDRLVPFIEACREVAREEKVPLVDHYAFWEKARNQGQSLNAWTTDGLHQNPEGQKILADLMLPALREALKSEAR